MSVLAFVRVWLFSIFYFFYLLDFFYFNVVVCEIDALWGIWISERVEPNMNFRFSTLFLLSLSVVLVNSAALKVFFFFLLLISLLRLLFYYFIIWIALLSVNWSFCSKDKYVFQIGIAMQDYIVRPVWPMEMPALAVHEFNPLILLQRFN